MFVISVSLDFLPSYRFYDAIVLYLLLFYFYNLVKISFRVFILTYYIIFIFNGKKIQIVIITKFSYIFKN